MSARLVEIFIPEAETERLEEILPHYSRQFWREVIPGGQEKCSCIVQQRYAECLIRVFHASKGLDVQCRIDENEYPKTIKVSDAEMAAINLACDDFHGEWNYTISPQPSR